MGNELLKMADGFALVAESIRALAALQDRGPEKQEVETQEQAKVKDSGKNERTVKTDKKAVQDSQKGDKAVTVEDIRAVLAQKSQDGKSKEIKELLGKYGVAKLSAVKPEDYPALLQEAKVL
mgnify:CR=1 FL=1